MIVSQCPGNIVSNMDGEKVMMNIENGKYYNLGAIGGAIWDLIASPTSTQEIVAALQAEYEVGQAECEQQVNEFLRTLADMRLVTITEEAV